MVAEQLEQPAAKRSSLAAHCSSNSSRAAAAAMSSGAAGKMGSPQKQELLYNSSGLNTVKISIYKTVVLIKGNAQKQTGVITSVNYVYGQREYRIYVTRRRYNATEVTYTK